VLIQRALQCLNGVHMAQSGALISLLVECFLDTHHLTLARLADALACRRTELLLADSGEVINNTLKIDSA
jgi:huntingtin